MNPRRLRRVLEFLETQRLHYERRVVYALSLAVGCSSCLAVGLLLAPETMLAHLVLASSLAASSLGSGGVALHWAWRARQLRREIQRIIEGKSGLIAPDAGPVSQ